MNLSYDIDNYKEKRSSRTTALIVSGGVLGIVLNVLPSLE
jgi:hypothetical protein